MVRRAILIVDDDSAVRDSLVALLTLEGYEPVTAQNGQEALALVAHHPRM